MQCKAQGAQGINVHNSVIPLHTPVNNNTLRLCLKREVDWIVFRLSGMLFHI